MAKDIGPKEQAQRDARARLFDENQTVQRRRRKSVTIKKMLGKKKT